MGLRDDIEATERLGSPFSLRNVSDGSDMSDDDEILLHLENAIQVCQQQAAAWRDLADVYAQYHQELCHAPRRSYP